MEEFAFLKTPRSTHRQDTRWSEESTFRPEPRSPLKITKRDPPAAPRLGPLAVTGKRQPSTPLMGTPPRRNVVGEHAKFTPFQDIKKDIDNLIEKLPTDFANLAKSDDGVVFERCGKEYGTQLALFLYSPNKKPSGLRPRTVDQPAQRSVSGEHKLTIQPAHSQTIDRRPVDQQQITPLLKRVRRRLKMAMSRLDIRTDDGGAHDSSTTKEAKIKHKATARRDILLPLPNLSRPQPATKSRSFVKLPIDNCERNISLPVITVSEPFLQRSPEDITSTLRKPLSSRRRHRRSVIIQKSPRHLPVINEILCGRLQARSSYRIQSQIASICEITALQHEIALANAPIAIKAAASLCVMAIAAAADFLVQDEHAKKENHRSMVVKFPAVYSRILQKR